MKFDRIDPEYGPTPQQLGAYADGELCADNRAAIDAWLGCHPAQADTVDALRRLPQLYREVPPPMPSPDAWSAVRAGIEKGLHERQAHASAPSWPKSRLVLAAAAAALFAVVFLGKSHWSVQAAKEPYPVVDAGDVAILSIDGNDCDCLVAAQPPVGRIDERDLAMSNDVMVLNLEEHWDRTVAQQRCEEGAPMLFTPPADWDRQP